MGGLLQDVLQDLRYGVRNLRRNSGTSAISLLTLAIGIGANTAIFSLVNGALLTPLPYADGPRIVLLSEKPPQGDRNAISTLTFLDWRRDSTVFDSFAGAAFSSMTLSGDALPVQVRTLQVSPSYFAIFSMKPALGRTFAPDEDHPGNDHVVVLGYPFWASRFGADPNVIGRTIRLNQEPYTVVGVLPAVYAYAERYGQLWTPLSFKPENMTRNFHWFQAFGKLKADVSLEAARRQMDVIGARIAREYPDSNRGWGVVVEPYADILVGADLKRTLYILLSAVGLVLLIGCANLANVALAGGLARGRELAVRAALGAGRHRLMRQILTEHLLLAFAGGLLGLMVGLATMRALNAALPPFFLPAEATIALDRRVLAFTLVVSMISGILFGVAPALGASQVDLVDSMKEGGGHGATGGRKHQRLRHSLIVAEIALSFILLTGSGLLIRSFFHMLSSDPGFDSTNVLTAGLPIASDRFADPKQLNTYVRQIVDRIEVLPGVRDVALSSALPLRGWGYGMPFQVANRPLVDRANRPPCFFKIVTPSYFRALGLRLQRGRALGDSDRDGAPLVTVINQTMVRMYFADQDPIGQRLLIQQIVPGKTQLGPEVAWEIVGVIDDERVTPLADKRDNPGVYVSREQSPTPFQNLVIRAATPPSLLEDAVRKAVYEVNKDQAVTDVKTLDQIKDESMAQDRLSSVLLATFAAIALLLAAVGIYGVIAYSVAQRTQEMGIRAALGASPGRLLGLVLQSATWLTVSGLVLGIVSAVGVGRLLAGFLVGVGPTDPLTLIGAAAVLGVVALLASYVPARRASRASPIGALRSE